MADFPKRKIEFKRGKDLDNRGHLEINKAKYENREADK